MGRGGKGWGEGAFRDIFSAKPRMKQDVDITAEELENKTEAVALFLNRADTEASARDSILTTCQELRIATWCCNMLQH